MTDRYYFKTENGETKPYNLSNDSDRINAYFDLRKLANDGKIGESRFLHYVSILTRAGLDIKSIEDSDKSRDLVCDAIALGRFDGKIPEKVIDKLLDDLKN